MWLKKDISKIKIAFKCDDLFLSIKAYLRGSEK